MNIRRLVYTTNFDDVKYTNQIYNVEKDQWVFANIHINHSDRIEIIWYNSIKEAEENIPLMKDGDEYNKNYIEYKMIEWNRTTEKY